jgi:hypothetical protein
MKLCVLVATLLFTKSSAFSHNIKVFGYTPSIFQTTPLGKKTSWGFFFGTTINPFNLHFDTLNYPAADIRLQFGNSFIYKPNPNITLAIGILYQRNFPFDSRYINEIRPYLQASISHKISKFTFTHRLRFSERFIQNKMTNSFPLTAMFQYMTAFQLPFKGNTLQEKHFYLTGYTEEYLTLSGTNKYQTLSEFWGYLGIGYDFGKLGKLQNGIVYEWNVRNKNKNTRNLTYFEMLWITNFDILKHCCPTKIRFKNAAIFYC